MIRFVSSTESVVCDRYATLSGSFTSTVRASSSPAHQADVVRAPP